MKKPKGLRTRITILLALICLSGTAMVSENVLAVATGALQCKKCILNCTYEKNPVRCLEERCDYYCDPADYRNVIAVDTLADCYKRCQTDACRNCCVNSAISNNQQNCQTCYESYRNCGGTCTLVLEGCLKLQGCPDVNNVKFQHICN